MFKGMKTFSLKSQYIFGVNIYCYSHNNHSHFNARYETLQILNWKESKIITMGDININMLSKLNSSHLNTIPKYVLVMDLHCA